MFLSLDLCFCHGPTYPPPNMISGTKDKNPTSTLSLQPDGSTTETDPASTMDHPSGSRLTSKFQITETNWPRFWICKSTRSDLPLSNLKIFALHKAILGMIGEVKQLKPMGRTGLLFIEVDRYTHVLNMIRTKCLVNIPVEFSPHRSLNSSQGVIYCRPLDDVPEEEVLKELNTTFGTVATVGIHFSIK